MKCLSEFKLNGRKKIKVNGRSLQTRNHPTETTKMQVRAKIFCTQASPASPLSNTESESAFALRVCLFHRDSVLQGRTLEPGSFSLLTM